MEAEQPGLTFEQIAAGIAALDALPLRLDRPLLFPAPAGGLLNLDNFRRRGWGSEITASGVAKPARIYDLRATASIGSTFGPLSGHAASLVRSDAAVRKTP